MAMTNSIIYILLLIPLINFFLAVAAPEKLKTYVIKSSVILLLLLPVLSIVLVTKTWDGTALADTVPWFELSESKKFTFSILVTKYNSLMATVVVLVAGLVALFSLEYMRNDKGLKRYYAFLNLFVFTMLGIILFNDVFLIFMCWEGVGLCSYLLIGHWYEKSGAAQAASKAFIVNRIGDAGFVVGLLLLWMHFGTFNIEEMSGKLAVPGITDSMWLTACGVCLLIGALGKSAQVPLQVWLPDAMAGPTPISALIHAATMVAAGVYLIFKLYPIFTPITLTILAFIGALTALLGALSALAQHDIKKVLAYSTISQLGYMMVGLGVGVPEASFFHLLTHAFFKANLFLAAGAIIHLLHQYSEKTGVAFDAQDMRNMGGLRKSMPVVFIMYLVGALALIGVPLFSGYLSKEAILSGAMHFGSQGGIKLLIPVISFTVVALTALYMTRQVMLVFFGKFRANSIKEKFTIPVVITVPLVVLSLLSIGFVWSINPFNFESAWLINSVSESSHSLVTVLSLSAVALGMAFAYFKYKPGGSYSLNYSEHQSVSLPARWSLSGLYLDKLYMATVVPFVTGSSILINRFDRSVLDRTLDYMGIGYVIIAHGIAWFDRTIVDGLVKLTTGALRLVGNLIRKLPGSQAQSYVLMGILAVLIILWVIIRFV